MTELLLENLETAEHFSWIYFPLRWFFTKCVFSKIYYNEHIKSDIVHFIDKLYLQTSLRWRSRPSCCFKKCSSPTKQNQEIKEVFRITLIHIYVFILSIKRNPFQPSHKSHPIVHHTLQKFTNTACVPNRNNRSSERIKSSRSLPKLFGSYKPHGLNDCRPSFARYFCWGSQLELNSSPIFCREGGEGDNVGCIKGKNHR